MFIRNPIYDFTSIQVYTEMKVVALGNGIVMRVKKPNFKMSDRVFENCVCRSPQIDLDNEYFPEKSLHRYLFGLATEVEI